MTSLANKPPLQATIEFLDTTGGRDKIARLLQYFAKFILPFIKNQPHLTKITVFIETVGAVMGLTRKVFKNF
jgi:hypothetical protein